MGFALIATGFHRSLRLALGAVIATAAPLAAESDHSPYLAGAVLEDFANYERADPNRAFAVAPGGAWGWVAGSMTPDQAAWEAVRSCSEYTEQPCHLYAVDGDIVIDAEAWAASWQLTPVNPDAPPLIGTRLGSQFPNLTFRTPDGQPASISDFRGQPIFVHFWGSWCPPCKHELPSIVELHDTLSTEGRIAFVLLQARESLEVSERWLARRKIELPLSDSGHESRSSNHFRLADGREVSDRAFARVFPTTYVLDSDGRVVFYKFGPIDDWMDYVDLFRNIK